jgi:hypothetical protein
MRAPRRRDRDDRRSVGSHQEMTEALARATGWKDDEYTSQPGMDTAQGGKVIERVERSSSGMHRDIPFQPVGQGHVRAAD